MGNSLCCHIDFNTESFNYHGLPGTVFIVYPSCDEGLGFDSLWFIDNIMNFVVGSRYIA